MRWGTLDWFLPADLREGDADPRRRARVLVAFSIVIEVSLATLALGAAVNRLWWNLASLVVGATVLGLCLWRLRRGARLETLVAWVCATVFAVASLGAYAMGGAGTPPLNWYGFFPMLALLLAGPRLGKVFLALGVLAHTAFILAVHPGALGPPAVVPPVLRYMDSLVLAVFAFALALIYESFKRRALDEMAVAQRRIEVLQAQLVETAHGAGMAEVASSVLHNVGNALNQVTTAAGLARDELDGFRLDGLDRLAARLSTDAGTGSERTVAEYVTQLAATLRDQRDRVSRELVSLHAGLDHVVAVVDSQQRYADKGAHLTVVNLREMLEDVVRLERAACRDERLRVTTELADVPPVELSKHRVLLVVTNLLRNALGSVRERGDEGRVAVRLRSAGGLVEVEVEDDGVGVAPEHAARIFRQGFTTKPQGHGFGLHSSAIAATELGGRLYFRSEGRGRGATFVLEFPDGQ